MIRPPWGSLVSRGVEGRVRVGESVGESVGVGMGAGMGQEENSLGRMDGGGTQDCNTARATSSRLVAHERFLLFEGGLPPGRRPCQMSTAAAISIGTFASCIEPLLQFETLA